MKSLWAFRRPPVVHLSRVLQGDLVIDGTQRRERCIAGISAGNRLGVLSKMQANGLKPVVKELSGARFQHPHVLAVDGLGLPTAHHHRGGIEAHGNAVLEQKRSTQNQVIVEVQPQLILEREPCMANWTDVAELGLNASRGRASGEVDDEARRSKSRSDAQLMQLSVLTKLY